MTAATFKSRAFAAVLGGAAAIAPVSSAFAVDAAFCTKKWGSDTNGIVSCMSTDVVGRNTLKHKGDSTPPFTINDPALPAAARGTWVCVSQGRSPSLEKDKVVQRACHHAALETPLRVQVGAAEIRFNFG